MDSALLHGPSETELIEINLNPEKKDLKVFSILLIPFGFIAGFLIDHYTGQAAIAWVVAGCLSLVGLVGLFQPVLVRWVFVGWMVLAFPIGWTLSHLVLAMVYFGMFLPVGLIARALGYDPLQLKDSNKSSYWLELEPQESKEQYFRQF